MNQPRPHTELAFEEVIEDVLLNTGYIKGNPKDFHAAIAIDTKKLFQFLKTSQEDKWKSLEAIHRNAMEDKVLQRLNKELQLKGVLHILRRGFTDMGVHFELAYFKPETSLNPDTERNYSNNILSITRQLKYSSKNENSLDVVLFLNGIPIITIELKNQFTYQSTQNAKRQYIETRDPRETIFKFKRGALAHFAVDTDEAYMTTELKNEKTFFLPFNMGFKNGAGNPPNPNGHRTAYLWEDIWQRDSILDIVGKFIHLQKEEYVQKGKKYTKEKMIFPRYHQLDVVRKLSKDAKANGAGTNYLVQHSAGSGKSNSIAWLAYRLFSLHKDDKQVFDSVIVITDRRVLDKQLQDTIYQFEHKHGVVKRIDQSSSQLAEAIKKGASIIITTLQKFPFAAVLDETKQLPNRNYAIIVDEAHSSQGGEASKKLKEVLSSSDEEDETLEDFIRKSMQARGKQENLSFFGFTATPKPKTIEVFGTPDASGIPKPFHLYSMRQAIQEGFIMDVLNGYMTYKTYFKVSKSIEENPKVNKKKAGRAIARFLSLHPYNLAQKTEVIIEHFRQIVAKKIGGKAKAMVVTSSRLHAVRYFFEFQRYIKLNNYTDVKPLVAFSGKVKDPERPDDEITEAKLNGFSEKELPAKFDSDEYQILLVAEKYQTGFDQPLLHTMYVDKKLSGVKAVQTLSRLNRIRAGKEDTFVLDFANEEQEIIDSFQPFYELTKVNETSDPNRLYDLKDRIEEKQVVWPSEINFFIKEYYKKSSLQSRKAHSLLNAYVDPAVDRFKGLESDEIKDDFKHTLDSYVKAYAFLSQIMPFTDEMLEKFYVYGKHLLSKLPKQTFEERFKLTDEVALSYYRLQKINENNLLLEHREEYELKPASDAGLRKDKEEEATLKEIIEKINDRLGTEFTEADKLFFDQIGIDLAKNATIIKQAKNNSFDKFLQGSLRDLSIQQFIDRMDTNNDTTEKMLTDEKLADAVIFKYLAKFIYDRVNI